MKCELCELRSAPWTKKWRGQFSPWPMLHSFSTKLTTTLLKKRSHMFLSPFLSPGAKKTHLQACLTSDLLMSHSEEIQTMKFSLWSPALNLSECQTDTSVHPGCQVFFHKCHKHGCKVSERGTAHFIVCFHFQRIALKAFNEPADFQSSSIWDVKNCRAGHR